MPKRKHSDENIVAKKLRQIESLLKKRKSRRIRIISTSSEDSAPSLHNQEGGKNQSHPRDSFDIDSVLLSHGRPGTEPPPPTPPSPLTRPAAPPALPATPPPSTSHEEQPQQSHEDTVPPREGLQEESGLDGELLEILGEDPTSVVEYGKNIRPELAARFNHIATNGMNKDYRKELCDKYLIPANCTLIGAPIMNAEVKIALNENTAKRDKLIESRQKRIATAISCIGEALSFALESEERDTAQIKRLMDTARLICDAQHNDSVSRRNLAVYSLKKEMKEPLLNTKIDKSLFGEQLTESLKAAKAVTKSGSELKTQFKPQQTKNWRTPAAGHRPPATVRRGAPAAPTTPAQPAPPPPPPRTAEPRGARAHASRRPPPPPPKYTRRRY